MAHTKARTGSNGIGYFTAYYSVGPQDYEPVHDPSTGRIARFPTKKAAQSAADEAEVDHRVRAAVAQATHQFRQAKPVGVPLFAVYADEWFGIQKTEGIVRRTINSYRGMLENHLLPTFGAKRLNEIDKKMVAEWVSAQQAAGAAAGSIRNRRALLGAIMIDAAEEFEEVRGNPAARKRHRGRRGSRNFGRHAELPIIDDLAGLLLAERAAILSRDDEYFVTEITRRWCGLREGELRGLQTKYVRRGRLRIEAQLSDDGYLEDPKDQSFRSIDLPPFLDRMLDEHITRAEPRPCRCHNKTFAFRGLQRSRPTGNAKGITQSTVAERAGLSKETVYLALAGKPGVSEPTRQRVVAAAADVGYTPADPQTRSAHWSDSSYRQWIYIPAATGMYLPARKGGEWRPVPVDATEFPGKPIRGRNAAQRATGRWEPLTESPRRHWNRHSHRTVLEEIGVPKVLIDERMGHSDSSVQGKYTHVTPAMRASLVDALEARWWAAVDARLAMSPNSPVRVLDELLQQRARQQAELPQAA